MKIYKVSSKERINPNHPLHVNNFYPPLNRFHFKTNQCRQDLILYLAHIHANALKSKIPLGFCEIQMSLTKLREWVYDYEIAFDRFFTVRRRGYNFGELHEISTVIPKYLDQPETITKAIELKYIVPPLPDDGVVSKVYVQKQNREKILEKLALKQRLDLLAPVKWLLDNPSSEINFYFAPAGKLKLRDTSLWPIPAIETWPSWLREDLFGGGIDIESAYTQYLIESLKEGYKETPKLVELLYSELLSSLNDKAEWRKDICVNVLGLEHTEENIGVVKKICMSLANGSKISPAILIGNTAFSVTKDIIIEKTDNISSSNLIKIGERLNKISKQYQNARKMVCLFEMKMNPSRKNQKKVFATYFEWEREARYKIWEAVNRHGIMVHDGIDGVPEEYMSDLPSLMREVNVRLTKT